MRVSDATKCGKCAYNDVTVKDIIPLHSDSKSQGQEEKSVRTVPIALTLPIHNAEHFLTECIHSIRQQTFGDFEVIALLDGCTDRSEEILMDMRDSRFVTLKTEHREGLTSALNRILPHASAPLIARMDADDVIDPRRLELQFEFMTRENEIDVLGTWFDYIDESGKRVRKAFPFPARHEDIKRGFRLRNSIGGATVMFRAERIRQAGGYPQEFPLGQDLALWLKCLSMNYRFANLPTVLYSYRQHGKQSSKERRAEQLRFTNLAYATYGKAIWGDDAPHFELSAPLPRRIIRRLKRLLKR
jgi:glycosyltransferase involved in cell wall biosynthesis